MPVNEMKLDNAMDAERKLGLVGATGVGVGAIVGGGILALAGVAIATTGPSAIVAFALNGAIALLTALSFAEMSSKFPESGGTYTFAKKVLSVEAAFAVGWVVWFASMVAAVLYAIGFAHFALAIIRELLSVATVHSPPAWLSSHRAIKWVAVGTTLLLSFGLMRRPSGGGHWVNIGKVMAFAVLIIGGLWALSRQSPSDVAEQLQPFFAGGLIGLIQAMGYTFIALQGFDLVAAVGGEVRDPSRNIPRAMVLSLCIALAIYLPLLLVIATVGIPPGDTISAAAAKDPEGIVAIAAQQYLGPFGYWLVMVAAVLSMFSALQANLFAASRIARAMARDRTLPSALALLSRTNGLPWVAVAVTATVITLLLIALPDVAAAGAAASLIFLITFALAHWIAILIRQRSLHNPPPFRTPLFPVVPVIGGLACVALAVFQGIAVPAAGRISIAWLSTGGLLYLALFARRARVYDASSIALDPELVRLRGRAPLVLVPIVNPSNAEVMVGLADALVPAEIGRVLAMTVVVAPQGWTADQDSGPIDNTLSVLNELLKTACRLAVRVEALTTLAAQPMEEIARVARLHRCESILIGIGEISPTMQGTSVEWLLSALDADIVALRAAKDWRLSESRRILVPIAGGGGHDALLARLIASLTRTANREVTFLRVVPLPTSPRTVSRIEQQLRQHAEDKLLDHFQVIVVRSDDPITTIVNRAADFDLMILGVRRLGRRRKLFGDFTRAIAASTTCPLIVLSRRG